MPGWQMDKERKSGLQSKIAETEAMVARLNIQLKHIEAEARQVEAVRKALEHNVNGKLGLSAVTTQCLEIKTRKVRVRTADRMPLGEISTAEATRSDSVLQLLHEESARQQESRELQGAHMEQARRTAHVLALYRQELRNVLRDKRAALRTTSLTNESDRHF